MSLFAFSISYPPNDVGWLESFPPGVLPGPAFTTWSTSLLDGLFVRGLDEVDEVRGVVGLGGGGITTRGVAVRTLSTAAATLAGSGPGAKVEEFDVGVVRGVLLLAHDDEAVVAGAARVLFGFLGAPSS